MENHISIAPPPPTQEASGDKERQHPPRQQIEKDQRQHEKTPTREIDETVEDSFPASDPPAWY